MSTVAAINLRNGDVRDLDLVVAIMDEAFDPRFGEAWTRNQVLGILAMPRVQLVVAELDGAAAGFALVRTVADEGELLLLAVTRMAQRRGVGSALLRAVIVDCTDRAVASLHLEVRAGNEAIRLYNKAGFTKVGERRDYYSGPGGQTYSALTLQRKLP